MGTVEEGLKEGGERVGAWTPEVEATRRGVGRRSEGTERKASAGR